MIVCTQVLHDQALGGAGCAVHPVSMHLIFGLRSILKWTSTPIQDDDAWPGACTGGLEDGCFDVDSALYPIRCQYDGIRRGCVGLAQRSQQQYPSD